MEAEEDTAETQETRIQTIETWEDGKGGAVEIRDNWDVIQGQRCRQAAENRGGGDAGKRVQRQHRCRNMYMAAEETPVKNPTLWTLTRTITSRR